MKNVKRLLSVLLAVCLLLTGIPMTALAADQEPQTPSYTGLFLRSLELDGEEKLNLANPSGPNFFNSVATLYPGSVSLGLNQSWQAAAYYIDENGALTGPLPYDTLTVTGDAELQLLKNVEGVTNLGDDPNDCMLSIAPKSEAAVGDSFTLTWNGDSSTQSKSAKYDIALPSTALYKENARTQENLLGDSMAYNADGTTELYLIIEPALRDWVTVDPKITDESKFAEITPMPDGLGGYKVYKITVTNPEGEFTVAAQWTMANPYEPTTTWSETRSIEMHPASDSRLVLRWLLYDESQNGWAAVPTDAPQFYEDIYYPGDITFGLGDRWFVAAYILGADGTVQQGPLEPDSIKVAAGNVTVQSLQEMNEEGGAALGDDADKLLCLALTDDADAGQTFTLQWEGPDQPSAEYDIDLAYAAFYSENTRDKAHLLETDLTYADEEDTVFYLILDPSEASKVSNPTIVEGNEQGATATEESPGVYKITVPAPEDQQSSFKVTVQWTRTDGTDTRTEEKTMWMDPPPYTGLVLRDLEFNPNYPIEDKDGNPVKDEDGNPITGAWTMPAIDQNNPLDRCSECPEVFFGEHRYVTVHYFDGERLSGPIDKNNLVYSKDEGGSGNTEILSHPSLTELQEYVYGEGAGNYLALSPNPQAAAGPGNKFTISWTRPQSNPPETYTCTGTLRMPNFGFYKSQQLDLPNMITDRKGGFEYSAENKTFYFMARPDFLHPDEHLTRTISNVRLELGARKAEISKVSDAVWKITLKEPPFEPFDYRIVVKCDVSQTRDGQPDGEWTEEKSVECHPQGVAGQMIGSFVLGGTRYAVRRTEAGIIYTTRAPGSPYETETDLPANVSFDPDTFTLELGGATLNGEVRFDAWEFNDGQPTDGQPAQPLPTLAINVVGENTINGKNGPGGLEVNGANLLIRGPGVLNINTVANALVGPDGAPDSEKTLSAPGIRLYDYREEDYTANLTVTGQVTVNVDTRVEYLNAKNYDRFAPCITGMFQDGDINLTVSDRAKLNLNAHGSDVGIRGLTDIVVTGKAQLKADAIAEFKSLTIGSDSDTDTNHASVVLNGQKERFQDWMPTLGGKKIEVKGYGELTINEKADDRSFSPSIFMDKDIVNPSANDGLFIGGHGKVTITNAHSLIVNKKLEVTKDATLTMSDGFGVGLRLESGSEATINGAVEISQVDNPYDNFCVWQFKGSTMTLNDGSSFNTSTNATADIPNFGFLTEGKLIIEGGNHSFKATGNGKSYGFVSQLNGVVEVKAGEMTAEGDTAALYTNSTHLHNYFTMADSLHIVSQDEGDEGTELGFVDGIVEGSSPTEYEFYLYQNNNPENPFVKKATIRTAPGTPTKAETATVTLQTASSPSAGARADFTANVNAPVNTEALVTVELPSGLSIVSGSITKDSVQQNVAAITKMPVMGPTVLRFSTDTTTAGDFPVTIKVFKDAAATEPLAQTTCTLTVRGFDISAPSTVGRRDVIFEAVGKTAPGATVTLKLKDSNEVYTYGVSNTPATATANWAGAFEMRLTLEGAGLTQGTPGEVIFDVYLTSVGGTETKQEKQLTVKYQPRLPELKEDDIILSIGTVVHDREDQPVKNTTVFPVISTITKVVRKTYPVWPSETDVEIIVKVKEEIAPNIKKIVIKIRRPGKEEPDIVELKRKLGSDDEWVPVEDYKFPIEDGLPKLFDGIWVEFIYVDPETGEEIPYVIGPMIAVPIIDPSGFVYEGNEDCRVEGVTAELYYSENRPSDPKAATGGELFAEVAEGNPLTTDALGQFGWMVPQGWWQVRFSKDGYNEAHTDWLPVQPVQTGLKIKMTATDTAAELVNSIERSEDGKYLTVTFSKPVNVDSVTAPIVTGQEANGDPIFDANSGTVIVSAEGKTVEGTFSPANGDGTTATKFHFVPSSGKLSPYAISIQAKAGIATYNGGAVTAMPEPHKESGRADGPSQPAGPTWPSVGGDEPSEEGTVENADGSVTMTETADDGTVTTTTTWPDGKESTTVVTPEGNVDIAVKDASGNTMAAVTIPAVIPDTGKKYEDVKDKDWFAENVYKTTNLGLFTGTSATKFSPKENLDRGMLVTVLHNMSGKPTFGTDKNVFPDIQGEEWYADAANWAKAMGVAAGTDKGFEPTADITRQDMVTMIYQYAKTIGLNPVESANLSRFKDGAKTSDYAQPAMKWAVSVGIISGKGNGILDPRGNATRAEASSILANFVKYLQK